MREGNLFKNNFWQTHKSSDRILIWLCPIISISIRKSKKLGILTRNFLRLIQINQETEGLKWWGKPKLSYWVWDRLKWESLCENPNYHWRKKMIELNLFLNTTTHNDDWLLYNCIFDYRGNKYNIIVICW